MATEELQSESWNPATEADRRAVREQLDRMLQSALFANSRRYPALLRFLVEQTLAGNESQLKERTLGVSVFHRAPDYDTNQDTVVRLAASEVRKRIAQYYHQPEHAAELQIDLHPGSYVPVFCQPPAPLVSAGPGPVAEIPAAEAAPPVALQGSAQLSMAMRRVAIAAVVIALLGAIALTRKAFDGAQSASSQLWAPILAEPGQVQIVVSNLSSAVSSAAEHDPAQAPLLLALLQMGEMVNYRDTLASSGVVAFLAQHGKPYALQLSTSASYPELQRGASVLVGGLSNLWTLRVTDPLRFHFVRRGQSAVFAIEDREHPEQGGWNVNMAQQFEHSTEDFALVARIFDQTTGRPVLIVAGLGANGTNAAAQFLLDPARTAELGAHAPRNWQHLNMEAVVRTQTIDNHAGPPRLVTCVFW